MRQSRGRFWRPTKLKDPAETLVQLSNPSALTARYSHTERSSALRQESKAAGQDKQRMNETAPS